MIPHVCKECGEPGAIYHSHGLTQQRPFCALHWAAYTATIKRAKKAVAGIPDDWKVTRGHWLKPPQGMTRIVVDGYRNRVTVYHGDMWKTVYFKQLKRLNRSSALVAFYIARQYRVAVSKHRWWVLEKDAA